MEATAFAIADNRTAELAEWDDEALAALLDSMDSDVLAATGFEQGELEAMLGAFDVDAIELSGLPDGDGSGIQQMTFTLHDDQVKMVKAAMAHAKACGPFGDTGNDNNNGNALARIAEAYSGTG